MQQAVGGAANAIVVIGGAGGRFNDDSTGTRLNRSECHCYGLAAGNTEMGQQDGAHHIVDEPQLGMLSVGHVEKNYATSGNLEISLSKVTG